MPDKVYDSPAIAIADVPDGATIMFGGFASAGTPTNLILALYAKGTRDITAIANNIGLGDKLDCLCEKKQLRKLIASFAIRASAQRRSLFEQLYFNGEVELEVVPQGTLAERIRAAGVGIPAFYTPAAVGTELAEGKEHRQFNGRTYLLAEALTADYAFVRARTADEFGNLVYQGSERNFNPLMATAARCTIVETEEILPVGSLDPNQVHTPGIYVHRLIQIPPDGIFHVQRARPEPRPRS